MGPVWNESLQASIRWEFQSRSTLYPVMSVVSREDPNKQGRTGQSKVEQLQAKEWQEPPETAGNKDSSWDLSEGYGPAATVNSGLCSPGLEESNFWYFKAPSLWSCVIALRKSLTSLCLMSASSFRAKRRWWNLISNYPKAILRSLACAHSQSNQVQAQTQHPSLLPIPTPAASPLAPEPWGVPHQTRLSAGGRTAPSAAGQVTL